MTDHAGEQAMELEALEAILMDDLQVYDGTNPIGWDSVGETYLVVIDPAEEGEESADDVEKLMELLFAHTANYPDEAPCVRLRALRGLSDAEIAAGMAHLKAHIEENMGMSMVFTLVSAAKEWLRSRVDMAQQETPEQERKRLENEEEFRRSEARRHGTMFTPELFAVWKAKFDKELADAKAIEVAAQVAKDPDRITRLSGKQFFQSNLQSDVPEKALSDDEEDYVEGEGGEGDDDEEDDEEDEECDFNEDTDDEDGVLDMVAATLPAAPAGR